MALYHSIPNERCGLGAPSVLDGDAHLVSSGCPSSATVGTPVTQRPPCRPGRAVCPPPVPRLHTLPHQAEPWPVLALLARARRQAGASASAPTWPGGVAGPGSGLPAQPVPWQGRSPPLRTRLETPPPPPLAGVPCDRMPPPPGLPAGVAGASHGRRHLSAGRPRPEDASGPAPARQHGGACRACGVRSTPRRPPPAPGRSGPRPSGDAAPPAASRLLCLRLVPLVPRAPTTPPWTHDARRVGGRPDPTGTFTLPETPSVLGARTPALSCGRKRARRRSGRGRQSGAALCSVVAPQTCPL
jgi:hypothetical protein